jgi:hypothetical protein
MRKWNLCLILIGSMATFVDIGCKKEETDKTSDIINVNENNRPPIANAGFDTTIILPVNMITLDASASTDPDNNLSTYTWKKIIGPATFTIQDSTSAQTNVTNLSLGEYRFELTVVDSKGAKAKDTCSVLVLAPQLYLYVSAHPSYSLLTATGNTSTILSGSAWINGLPANIISKEWKKISGPDSYTINSPSSFEILVTGLTTGVYQFQFKAISVNGLSDSSRVTVAVIDPLSPNQEVILQNQQWNYGGGFGCPYLEIDLDQYLPPGTPVKKIFIKSDCTSVWHELVMVSANTNNEAYSYQILNGHLLDVEWCNSGCNYLDTPDLKIVY